MFNLLESILVSSGLVSLFEIKKREDNTAETPPWVAYRLKTNIHKIRSFELWKTEPNTIFRIYHAPDMNEGLKTTFESLPGVVKIKSYFIDYQVADFVQLATAIAEILASDEVIKDSKATSRLAHTSKFEGLKLPDVDTSMEDAFGQTFTWKEVIAIWEDKTEENKLKKVLSQNGVYIQRSIDGTSRYIGSAYGSGGIIGRWMAHLEFLGNAHHLNLYVLENGYDSLRFSVIEFIEGTDSEIIQKESLWKKALGTVNKGPYNEKQLNKN
ncbi:GIY-YIG nuclease family protein [Ureibacillus aquaedulcis]|uniref:GIY-YIG nuclease family protein n=1 Tax=Ureibacillus aquaedulcis TaxID=3058421 RepID=A0ABT8GML2_9BACL|nr:GIY-YIG nuclease family protein [Ureibacillus sp. BA0131]MDN4492161.1 GIY-YIG nuclease family protein [Ureibacillus sp. BA0131]